MLRQILCCYVILKGARRGGRGAGCGYTVGEWRPQAEPGGLGFSMFMLTN